MVTASLKKILLFRDWRWSVQYSQILYEEENVSSYIRHGHMTTNIPIPGDPEPGVFMRMRICGTDAPTKCLGALL